MTEASPCRSCGYTRVSSEGPCPNCGREFQERGAIAPQPFRPDALIKRYFSDLWQIITQPARFFRRMPLSGGLAHPLAFALVTHWLGSAFEFLWRNLLGGVVGGYFGRMFRVASDVADIDSQGRGAEILQLRERMLHWFWGAGSVIVDPFFTLFQVLFISFFVWVGARLLVTPGKDGAPSEITFESAVRLICFGLSPAILACIPILGSFTATLLTFIVTVVGAREIYRVRTGRAIAIALFPKLLFFAIIIGGLGFLLFVGIRLVTSHF